MLKVSGNVYYMVSGNMSLTDCAVWCIKGLILKMEVEYEVEQD